MLPQPPRALQLITCVNYRRLRLSGGFRPTSVLTQRQVKAFLTPPKPTKGKPSDQAKTSYVH